MILRTVSRFTRRLLKPAGFAFAFLLPTLVAIGVTAGGVVAQNPLQAAPPIDEPLPEFPRHDGAKLTAVIVAGNAATEVSDLLGPYETLAASDAFNVYVVAPERRASPLMPMPLEQCCAPVDMVPHFSFAEYDTEIGTAPDLIVVPYIPLTNSDDAAVLQWLRERPSEQTVILSICGGAQMVADAGILDGHTATSHHTTLNVVEKTHPEVSWVRGLRYVDDGRFVSSAGVTSGIDATLYVIQRFVGRDTALATAQRIGYPHARYLDDPTWEVPSDSDVAALPNVFRYDRTRIGLFLYSGVGEIEIGSITDTYPRALATDVLTLGVERQIIRTRHGLNLIPRHSLGSVSGLDRLLIPGQPGSAGTAAEQWAGEHLGRSAERVHPEGVYAYDAAFADMSQQETRLIASNAARWIEYPVGHLDLRGRAWATELIIRPFALGLLGVGLLLGWLRLRRWAPRATPAFPKPVNA
jgi:transcriptional regulator GlxA family with amidase domain